MKSHEIISNSMKSYQIPWISTFSTNPNIFFWPKKKQPAVAGGPCLLGRHGLIGRGHRSPTTRLHGSQGVLFHPGSRKMARKGSQNHWESLENVMKCHEMSHISSDIYWYLRYISDISCLGRFVRWIRRSCNDVMVLDVDLGVILGMTGYLDIRKVGRSQPTKRGPLWHGTWWKFKGRMSRQDWERLALNLAGGFQPHGYPQSIHVNKMFHYKPLINHPAIWGYPFFRKPPSVEHPSHLLGWKVSNSMIKLSTHQSRIQSLDKEVSQPMISQSTNQPTNQSTHRETINQSTRRENQTMLILNNY